MTDDLIGRAEAQTAIQFAAKRYTVAHEAHGEGQVVWSDNLINVTDAMNVLRDLPSAQPKQRWIPCSERLPEKEGWYITTVESEKTGKRRIENDLFAVDIALAHGHTPNKFCKDGYRQRTVAWMPFPEPYCGCE